MGTFCGTVHPVGTLKNENFETICTIALDRTLEAVDLPIGSIPLF